MPDVRAFRSVVEAAEAAAAAGDVASAEALLREAAGLQEAEFGPLHPDLASTFNNLAVLCEMAERPVEAEQFYRRAYAIATATLDPEHPLVATSRDNLRDFCEARGLPLDDRAAAPVAPPITAPVAASVTAPGAPPIAPPVAAPAVAPRRSIRRAAMWAALILVLLAAVAGMRMWSKPAPAAALTGTTAPPEAAPSAPPARPPQGAPAPEPVPPPAAAPRPEVAPPTAAAASPDPAPAASTPAGVRVVVATVCQTLTTGGAWRCAPAGDPSGPGPRAFYTRIASPRPVRVRHLWYHEDRLRQNVALRVGANDRDGYRTFSRQTVGPGEWRVELRADNGALLDQARFVVR